MRGASAAPRWRLKVINGCDRNDDVILPVVPQSSLLQPFYEQWSEEDEERHMTAEYTEAERVKEQRRLRYVKKKNKRGAVAAAMAGRRNRIALREWLQKIPHVPLGRHTHLPASCRLRHACVSRLQCRVAYIGDATTQRQILSKYPPAHRMLKNGDAGKGFCVNNIDSDKKKCTSANTDEDHDDPAVFHEPYYRVLNCGSNPLYVNAEPLPRGASRRLREHDIVAFLENPFDEEGGVLQPLLPGDVGRPDAATTSDGDDKKSVKVRRESKCPPTPCTARVLFDHTSSNGSGGGGGGGFAMAPRTTTSPVLVPAGDRGQTYALPVFVEVNGVRIARHRSICVPPAVAREPGGHTVTAAAAAADVLTEGTPFKQTSSPFFPVEHKCPEEGVKRCDNDVVTVAVVGKHVALNGGGGGGGGAGPGLWPRGIDENLTPPPPQRPSLYEVQAGLMGGMGGDKGDDILGEVVSPLQQRLVVSPRRCRSGGTAYGNPSDAPPLTIIPPRLPVYVFARRSPSPVAFTRQAPSIARCQQQQQQQQEQILDAGGATLAAKKTTTTTTTTRAKEEEEEMVTWVEEETSAAAPAVGSRKRHRRRLS